MATIHQATLSPSKLELLAPWIAARPWAPPGEARVLGAYRLDDRDGQVGIEGHLLDVAGRPLHVVTTYRAAPLEGADAFLIGTTEHSVLGTRWVYDATGDPIAQRELVTAALTGAAQADLVVVDAAGREVQRRPSAVRLQGSGSADRATFDHAGYEAEVVHVLDGTAGRDGDGIATLAARWGDFDDAVTVVVVHRV